MNWYLLHTKPRQEARALENLERQGYICYQPTLAVERIRRGKRCAVVEPLFARYLFLQLDESGGGQSWSPIRSTLGVSRLVTFGGQPAKVDDSLIALLRARVDAGNVQPERLFASGERVRVLSGPFAGIEVIYEMDDGDHRAIVLIELLNRLIRVTVPTQELKSA